MPDFTIDSSADFDAGVKNDTETDLENPLIAAGKLGSKPLICDRFAGGARIAGWDENKDTYTTLTDEAGAVVIYGKEHEYGHLQRAPGVDNVTIQAKIKWAYASPLPGSNTWAPCIVIYWDRDNWVNVGIVNDSGTLKYGYNYNVASTTTYAYSGSLTTETWYWVKIVLTATTFTIYTSTDGSSWNTLLGATARPGSWTGTPDPVIFGKGYSDLPTYVGNHFNSSYATPGNYGTWREGDIVVLPYKSTGDWRSASITMGAGRKLTSVTLTVSGGTASRKLTKVEILRASDNAVLSTYTGSITSTVTLLTGDFDMGFDPTLSTNFKVKVYFASDGTDTILLDSITGTFTSLGYSMGKYQYKVLVGAKSTETDSLFLKSWKLTDGRNEIPEMEMQFSDTTDAESILEDQVVEMYRREAGEGSWGDSCFIGTVRSINKPLRESLVIVRAEGYLGNVFERTIPNAGWGNTHVVDQAIGVDFTLTSGAIIRQSVELDNNLPPQVPLERLRYLMVQEGIWWCSGAWVAFTIYDTGGTSRKVAQQFMAHSGELRKFWVKGYQNAGNAADLIVEVQTDTAGVPSGTVVSTYTVPKASFGVGVGNESYVEIDLLTHVADPTTLRMMPGQIYWLVLRASAAGANNYYYIRATDTTCGPNNTRMKTSVNGAAYALDANSASLIFMMDFESHWVDLDMTRGEYMVETLKNNNNTIFFVRKTLLANDVGGQFNWNKWAVQAPILYTGQKLVRATYWKGTMTYATVLQKWADAVISDITSTISISITEPATKQFCIVLENATGLDALKSMLQYCPVVVRIYKTAAGVITMEIRDALAPTPAVWTSAYTLAQRDARTFYDGRDTTTQGYIRIADGSVFRNLVKKVETVILKDAAGNILSGVGSILGSGKSTFQSAISILGGTGAGLTSPVQGGSYCIETALTVEIGGNITVEGIDQSMATGPFRHANELCYVYISRKGVGTTIYAINGMQWSGGVGKPTKLILAFINQQWTNRFVSTDKTIGFMVNGSLEKLKVLPSGSTLTQGRVKAGVSRNSLDGKMTNRLEPAGATDCPTSGLEDIGTAGISLRADMPIMHRDATHTYLPAKVYYLQLGTGTPGGGVLGYKVAEIVAQAVQLSSGFVVIQGKFRRDDFNLASSWPLTITEFGLGYADDNFKTGFTQVGAYTVGSPGAGKSTFGIQPEVIPGRRVTVIIQVTKP